MTWPVWLSLYRSFSNSVGVVLVSASTNMRTSVSRFPGQEIRTAIEASVFGPTTTLVLEDLVIGVSFVGVIYWKLG